jgi:hypothetical protein
MLDNKGTPIEMRCENGHTLEVLEVPVAGFTVPAMVCPICGFVTLTLEQAKRLQGLQQLQELLGGETKITRVGDSLGIQLPKGIGDFGIKEGQQVKVDLSNSHQLEFAIETALTPA